MCLIVCQVPHTHALGSRRLTVGLGPLQAPSRARGAEGSDYISLPSVSCEVGVGELLLGFFAFHQETRLRGYVTSLTTGFIIYALVGYYYYCFVAHICLAMGTRIKQRLTLLGGFPLTKADSFITLGFNYPDADHGQFVTCCCVYI
jgi:hypothetical protein